MMLPEAVTVRSSPRDPGWHLLLVRAHHSRTPHGDLVPLATRLRDAALPRSRTHTGGTAYVGRLTLEKRSALRGSAAHVIRSAMAAGPLRSGVLKTCRTK